MAIAIAVVLLLVGIAGGYFIGNSMKSSSSTTKTTTPVEITELGSSLLFPLMQKWGPNYTAANPNVILSPAPGGSGAGQSNAELGLVNIGASDGYLVNASQTSLINVPVAISAQLVYYNLATIPASEHLNLNGTMLAEIYSGVITKWNDSVIMGAQNSTVQKQLNALANTTQGEQIYLVKRSDSSGDTFLFTSLCQESWSGWTYGASTSALSGLTGTYVIPEQGNTGMVSGAQKQADSIAYIGISYEASAAAAGLGYAALGDNSSLSAAGGLVASNYVLPTASTISQDANLGLTHLNFAQYQTAVSLILGGSPLGAVNLTHGAGGTAPTATSPDPYPIVNLEYTLIKTSPTGNVVSATALQATVEFLIWAVSNGNFAPTGGPSAEIQAVNFVPLTPAVIGYDMQELSTVTW
ncbi:MAG TPA: substrate-binding domain-containing protein [Thermoplasmata archaeon]|nr:substrate-binding domain-containing protein [Thermoplasmata archaeon]